jgi:hypothetical protein
MTHSPGALDTRLLGTEQGCAPVKPLPNIDNLGITTQAEGHLVTIAGCSERWNPRVDRRKHEQVSGVPRAFAAHDDVGWQVLPVVARRRRANSHASDRMTISAFNYLSTGTTGRWTTLPTAPQITRSCAPGSIGGIGAGAETADLLHIVSLATNHGT